jgi:hypothetical protein
MLVINLNGNSRKKERKSGLEVFRQVKAMQA